MHHAVCAAGHGHEFGLAVQIYFINEAAEAFAISTADIYGSSAADFDLNISRTARALPSLKVAALAAMKSLACHASCHLSIKLGQGRPASVGRAEEPLALIHVWSLADAYHKMPVCLVSHCCATCSAGMQALAEELRRSADVVMPMNLGNYASTAGFLHELEAAGVPHIGPPADVASLTNHKLR